MSLQTPRQRPPGLQRPSYGTQSTTSPGFSASTTTGNRKASLQALTGQGYPRTPGSRTDGSGELEVGDAVNVPGEMFGLVKFVGTVKGKSGRFVGVELDKDFAAKGKNSGDVEGTNYFNTTIPGAGIFLPVHRAEKRYESGEFHPGSPNTPSYSTVNGHRTEGDLKKSSTPAMPHKFSQTVGPGVRPSSPNFKPKRPSMTRPESPLRKNQPNLAPTPSLSQSTQGRRPGVTPSKIGLKSSTTSRLPSGLPSPRPYSRSGSRLERHDEDEDRTPVGLAATYTGRGVSSGSGVSYTQPLRSPSRVDSGAQDHELEHLKKQLEDRDRRLEEQAASLAEMETSVKELSAILPHDGLNHNEAGSLASDDEQTAAQLRQMLREKNEKITLLTSEFDSHRADFRSTLDSLEMASTETERVYEEQKRDLLAQLAELQDLTQSKEDFEGVAHQLKQLEELVAELEEGLEESRRGEAEARGEVEFLRGEVERGRSELRREREKAAAGLTSNGDGSSSPSPMVKEMEKKDDEIRGLKAIIHGLSGSGSPTTAVAASNVNGFLSDTDEVARLQRDLNAERLSREELEEELDALRRENAATNGDHQRHARHESDRTAVGSDEIKPLNVPGRRRADTVKAVTPRAENESSPVYCEMCSSDEHDTLDCDQLNGTKSPSKHDDSRSASPASSFRKIGEEDEGEGSADAVAKKTDGKSDGKEDGEKWCALCEKEGHLAFDCPEEQY